MHTLSLLNRPTLWAFCCGELKHLFKQGPRRFPPLVACFAAGVVSHSSLGLEKTDPARLGPGGGMGGRRWMNTGGGRSWTPTPLVPTS